MRNRIQWDSPLSQTVFCFNYDSIQKHIQVAYLGKMKMFYSLQRTVKLSGTQKYHSYQEMKSWKRRSRGKVSHPFHRVCNDSDLDTLQISLIILNSNTE